MSGAGVRMSVFFTNYAWKHLAKVLKKGLDAEPWTGELHREWTKRIPTQVGVLRWCLGVLVGHFEKNLIEY